MLRLFILEDEITQQFRIEKTINELIATRALPCKAPETFDNRDSLLQAITERGAHQLFFLDIEIKGEEKSGLSGRRVRSFFPAQKRVDTFYENFIIMNATVSDE